MTSIAEDSTGWLGIDMGGTNTRIGFFPSLKEPAFVPLTKFPTQVSYIEQIKRIEESLHGKQSGRLQGIGMSVAARVARDGRTIVFGPNLPNYLDQPLAADLEKRFACPVRLGHDTVCGLLGEKRFGVLRDYERCAYLTVSTGTGAALSLGKGELALYSSIEIGHQVLDGNERVCLCGQIGCLETYTGGRQIELRYGKPLKQLGDPAFWETFTDKLALGLLNLVQLTRIDAVAVSGAIVLQNALLLPLLQEKLDKRLKNAHLRLLPAHLREDAPLIGAACLCDMDEGTILH